MFEMVLTPDYDVRIVKSAADALRYLNSNTADVILLDIEMPNISGFEFLFDIKRIPSYVKVPIIIVSSNSGEDFVTKARDSKAFDVLSKPVMKDVLIEAIEAALA
jgi:CheY-like chemotaxis protein